MPRTPGTESDGIVAHMRETGLRSRGTLTPRAGTLYRVIARLMTAGYVEETGAPDDEGRHPGRARRYYELSGEGRMALSDEARRLKETAALAEDRLSVGRA